jgi:hypothetical protein
LSRVLFTPAWKALSHAGYRPPSSPVRGLCGRAGIVSQAGGVLLSRTLVTGLDTGLSVGLARWRPGRAVHDPGKIIADLAVTLALGGDCWPTWRCCGPSRGCSGRWPRTPWSRGWSAAWPVAYPGPSKRSARRGLLPRPGLGTGR